MSMKCDNQISKTLMIWQLSEHQRKQLILTSEMLHVFEHSIASQTDAMNKNCDRSTALRWAVMLRFAVSLLSLPRCVLNLQGDTRNHVPVWRLNFEFLPWLVQVCLVKITIGKAVVLCIVECLVLPTKGLSISIYCEDNYA